MGRRSLARKALGLRGATIARKSCQARDREAVVIKEANLAVDSLNWLAGYASQRPSARTGIHRVQAEVHARILSLVRRRHPDADTETPEAAARTLLRGRLDRYACAAGSDHLSIAAFRSGEVSLPDSVKGSLLLSDTLDADAKGNLEAGHERMLRSERSRADIERRQGPAKPYSDPLLVRNRRRCRRFILDLDARGMLRYTRFPKAHVGVFFVWKKVSWPRG